MIDKSEIEQEQKEIKNTIEDLTSRERVNGVIISARISSSTSRDLMLSEFETVDGHLADFKKVIEEKLEEVSNKDQSRMYG